MKTRAATFVALLCGLALGCGGKSQSGPRVEREPGAAGDSGKGGQGSDGSIDLTECVRGGIPEEGPGFCGARLACPGTLDVSAACRGEPDAWQCTCSARGATTDYAVSGFPSSAVCEAVAQDCASREVPNGPEECSFTDEQRAPTYCLLARTCARPIDLVDGVKAALTTDATVHCAQDGTGRLACDCDDGRAFLVSGHSGLELCDALLEVCAGRSAIDFESEPACAPDADRVTGTSCEASLVCRRDGELTGGGRATENAVGTLVCENLDGGGANCTCWNARQEPGRIALEAAADAGGTCSRFASLCGDLAPVALSSELECTEQMPGGDAEHCYVGVDCKQAALFDGQRLSVYGSVWADCLQVEDRYVCTCRDADEAVRIAVDAASVADACTTAATECLNVVSVTIGDGVIPEPLPGPT